MSKIEARCIICNYEAESTEGLNSCPKCGSVSNPCDPAEDVTVKINWHELRILSIWAEFWANKNEATSKPNASMRQCIVSITRRLEVQHPELTPLTLSGELRELKKEMPGMKTNIPMDEGFDPTNQ